MRCWILFAFLLPSTAAIVGLSVQEMNDIVAHLKAYQRLLAAQQATSISQQGGVQTAVAASPLASLSSSFGMGLPAGSGTQNVAFHAPAARSVGPHFGVQTAAASSLGSSVGMGLPVRSGTPNVPIHTPTSQHTGMNTALTSQFSSLSPSVGMSLPVTSGSPNVGINTPTSQQPYTERIAPNTGVQSTGGSQLVSFSSSVGLSTSAATAAPMQAINTPPAQMPPTSPMLNSPGLVMPTSSTFRTSASPLRTTPGRRPMLTSFASTTIERPTPTTEPPTTLPPTTTPEITTTPPPEVTTTPPPSTTAEPIQPLPEAFKSLEIDMRRYLILFHNHTDSHHKKGKEAGDEATKLEYKALYVGGSKGHAYKMRAEGLRQVEKYNVETFKALMEVKKDVEEFMRGMNMRAAQLEMMYPPSEPSPMPV